VRETAALAVLAAPSRFAFAGVDLVLPASVRFCDIQLRLEHGGEPVHLTIRRRDAKSNQDLERSIHAALVDLLDDGSPLKVIRQDERGFAGSRGAVVDFHFIAAHEARHGRLFGALLPVPGDGGQQQWLDISCVIDPSRPALSGWLAEFDGLIDSLTPS